MESARMKTRPSLAANKFKRNRGLPEHYMHILEIKQVHCGRSIKICLQYTSALTFCVIN